jgi:hypothetical protein
MCMMCYSWFLKNCICMCMCFFHILTELPWWMHGKLTRIAFRSGAGVWDFFFCMLLLNENLPCVCYYSFNLIITIIFNFLCYFYGKKLKLCKSRVLYYKEFLHTQTPSFNNYQSILILFHQHSSSHSTLLHYFVPGLPDTFPASGVESTDFPRSSF